MTRSIARQPLSPDDDLANVAVAFAVLHFYVLGHRDSYGSCRECHEIVDRAAPEYAHLRSPNTRGTRADGSSTTRWDLKVLDLVDPNLFPRLVRARPRWVHPVEAPPAGGFTALAAPDVEVIRAAIDEGRSFPASGLLGQFRCTPNDPTTPHDKGGASTGQQSCSHCIDLAFMAAAAFDRRAAPADADERPGRLRAIAKHTLYRTSLGLLVLTSPQIVRAQLGLPAKPDADLPDGIARTIDERSHRGPLEETDERPYPTLTYLEMILEMKFWALEVVDPTPEENLPVHRIGTKLGLSSAEADRAWQFIVDACSEVPSAQKLLQSHLLDHLDRRRGDASLSQPTDERTCAERETTDALQHQFQAWAYDDGPSLDSDVIQRLLLDWRIPLSEVTLGTVRNALADVLVEWAADPLEYENPSSDLDSSKDCKLVARKRSVSMGRSGDVSTVLLTACKEADMDQLANSAEFENFAVRIFADLCAYGSDSSTGPVA